MADKPAGHGTEQQSGGVGSRIGASLRSARLRAGWSREALAHHSGLTWSAIAQIESGRRRDVHLSTLSALADALGVSVDYLVGGRATVGANLLEHRALIYSSDEEFLASAAPFVAEGVMRGEAVLAVTASRRSQLLRKALGGDASHVEFADSARWYRSPWEALDRYRTFVTERFERGAPWVRVVGEPRWEGRSDDEVRQWTCYESIFNLSLASSPATVVCPYDAGSLPDGVIADARHTHPTLAVREENSANPEYQEPGDFLLRGR